MRRRAALGLCAATAVLVAGGTRFSWPRVTAIEPPETVRIAAGTQTYRPAGEFRQGTQVVDAPQEQRAVGALDIMKYQVSEADFAGCVAEGACRSAPTGGAAGAAQTGISYADATDFAAWVSRRTGEVWRLPSDAEWLRAAGDRAAPDGLDDAALAADPSRRWIASYAREVKLRGAADLAHHPQGYFGLNDRGIADIAGNVWDWTDSCFENGTLSADGRSIAERSSYCGVRAVQGKHRAFIIEFIRDARVGGCAAGVPPDYLGFRLVRDGDG